LGSHVHGNEVNVKPLDFTANRVSMVCLPALDATLCTW